MRPLTTNQKTAFIFYLAYAGLLCFISVWSPAKPAISGQNNPEYLELEKGLNDLTPLQSSFDGLWKEALARKGWNQESLLVQAETKLEEKRLGKNEVKWINAKSQILLPAGVTEQDMVELVNEWEKINRSLKIDMADLKWGYQKDQLWLRLSSELPVAVPGGIKKLPMQQLTLVTPSKAALHPKWTGLIPRLPPKILPPVKIEVPKIAPVIKKPRVALIIDDVGSVRKAADSMLQVNACLTWAVLPFTPYAGEYAEAARERGFEVILHLPLEPLDLKNNPGPGLIKRDWTDEEIIKQLDANLNQVPGAVGINNHMGSAGTADERLMETIMGFIKDKNIYFVDSMTSLNSLGETVARRHQVRFNKRDVFIDNLGDIDSKKKALRQLIKIALKKGEAIGIGHVRNGTAEAIIEMLPEFEKAGIEIVPVSKLLDR